MLGQAEVVPLSAEPFLEERGLFRGDRNTNSCVPFMKAAACGRQQGMRERWNANDGELTPFESCESFSHADDPIQPKIRALDFIEQIHGASGRVEAPLDAVKQSKADKLLEPRQFAADRGLRGMEGVRCRGNASRSHYRPEYFDVPMRDGHINFV